MKTYKLTQKLLTVILAIGMAGCSLEEKPYGFYSSDNFYKTEADAESGLMYAYNALNYLEYLRGIWYVGDIPTETMYPKPSEPGDIHSLQSWTVNSNTELTWYYFKYCFIGINRTNTVIDRVETAPLSEAVKNKVTGEAYFLRAWNYFNLVRTFGLVPVSTASITSVEQTTPPMANSIEEIYNLVIADLRKAESLLEVNKVFGRTDKVAAQAMLAKVYLNIASGKEHNAAAFRDMTYNVQQMYDSAAYYARKVVNDYNTSYYFDPDIRHIFDVYAPEGPEHIFIMAIDRSGTYEGQYSKIPLQFLPDNGGADIYIKFSDASLLKGNGNGWGVFRIEESFVNRFLPIDKRRIELIHNKIYNSQGNEIRPATDIGYFSAKYVDPEFNGQWTSARPFLIRYSDIALVLAEAVGPTAEGYAAVNSIRRRAGVPDITPGLDVAVFRERVIEERALELAFEGDRLFDLRRTASVTKTAGAHADRLSEDEAAFYPIPQREIDLNPNVN
jgi:hypothetical protein